MAIDIKEASSESTRAEWLARRLRGIGASESPAVLGLSPWKTRYQLWAEKCGLVEQDDLSGNEAVEFGCRLEKPIAEAFRDRTGREVAMWPQHQVAQHHDLPWLICTPDATQYGDPRGPGLVQIKTTSEYKRKEWDEGPPLAYQVQCQHELAVTGHTWGTLVVLIGGNKLRFVDFDRNEAFIAAMLPQLEEFWRLVETRTPPEVDGSLATAKALAKLHPDDNGDTALLPREAQGWSDELEAIKEDLKRLEHEKTERENRLKAALGDATYGLLPDGSRWSWKSQTRKSYTVAEATFRVLRKLK